MGTIFSIVTLLLFLGVAVPALGSLTDASGIGEERLLEYQGQVLSSELQTVDQLVRRSSSDGTIGRRVGLSDRIGNEPYTIRVIDRGPGNQSIVLETNSGRTSVRVLFVSETAVTNTTVRGGPLTVRRPDGERSIRVAPAP